MQRKCICRELKKEVPICLLNATQQSERIGLQAQNFKSILLSSTGCVANFLWLLFLFLFAQMLKKKVTSAVDERLSWETFKMNEKRD